MERAGVWPAAAAGPAREGRRRERLVARGGARLCDELLGQHRLRAPRPGGAEDQELAAGPPAARGGGGPALLPRGCARAGPPCTHAPLLGGRPGDPDRERGQRAARAAGAGQSSLHPGRGLWPEELGRARELSRARLAHEEGRRAALDARGRRRPRLRRADPGAPHRRGHAGAARLRLGDVLQGHRQLLGGLSARERRLLQG
mmetsp:Transcript_43987/g.137735  ORF Transcript_43987/g.137735 Transcript_43987/m.137735 type:complete len:202 (+) Transcript_43987:1284-1889(+)